MSYLYKCSFPTEKSMGTLGVTKSIAASDGSWPIGHDHSGHGASGWGCKLDIYISKLRTAMLTAVQRIKWDGNAALIHRINNYGQVWVPLRCVGRSHVFP